jgi:hypothetical protein
VPLPIVKVNQSQGQPRFSVAGDSRSINDRRPAALGMSSEKENSNAYVTMRQVSRQGK